MPLHNYDDLNDIHLDVLREIGNIGSGNAASALSAMLDEPIDIAVPKIQILDYTSVVDSLGGPEQILVGILLQLSGDITGMIMFLMRDSFVRMMLSVLTGGDIETGQEVDEMSKSAIQEVGNIMAASYVNAIGSLTGLEIQISVPELCVDMAGSMLSVPAIYYANISDKIIFIEDEFIKMGEDQTESHVLLIPEVDSLSRILSSLGLEL